MMPGRKNSWKNFGKSFRKLLAALAVALLPQLAMSQEVSHCDQRAQGANIAEPWEQNSRSFANGAVRIALLDTIEPGAVPFQLLVLSPPYGVLGDRQCRVIGFDQGMGFGSIDFGALEAGYDPATGLTFSVPVVLYLPEEGFQNPSILHFTLNQATGEIDARLELGPE